ncbi:hypothetical protein HBN50_13510 [Halobacteriovorax sp. GB3]|uniref:hypothetical protein n=1 Tax=Halobacteriovorax sp. GB3 TaxID=2719615 RepID=UPI00235DF345|nr:hypothetical protein [Halobacteriovorax sp. GB3]MDD0854124.1 hypothetical protein [Halobacteriovorax sp. GB3]
MKKLWTLSSKIFKDLWVVFNIKKALEDEEIKFRLLTTLKITGITFFTFLIAFYFIAVNLNITLLFFESHGYTNLPEFRSIYYDFVSRRAIETFPLISLYLIFVVFTSMYISDLLLRPFRAIAKYCDDYLDGKSPSYDPAFFTDLKLLSNFSEWFFNTIESFYENERSITLKIPKKFTKIHRPFLEKNFLFHYAFAIILLSVGTLFITYTISIDVYSEVIELARETISTNKEVTYFLKGLGVEFQNTLYGIMVVHVCLSFLVVFHLYNKVAGASFGFFATMRSFIKGKYDARVHLVGYYYVRDYSRKLNRFLKKVSDDFQEKS